MRFVHLGHGSVAGDPGVVHQHVQTAEALDRRGHQRLYVCGRCDVRAHRERRPARVGKAAGRCRDGAFVDVGKRDGRSFVREELGHRQTEPPPRSRDHRALARQTAHAKLIPGSPASPCTTPFIPAIIPAGPRTTSTCVTLAP